MCIRDSAPAAPSPDAEVGAFRAAHDAHFRGADPARALAAWDAYLAAYPRGRLVLEARWNRAIALLKLGHDREARAALAPFAAGAEGEYRQREARHLLDVLDQRGGK